MTFGFHDQSLFDAAVERCELLTREQARDFIHNGYVIVREAFSKNIADEIAANAWIELEEKHGVLRDDPATAEGESHRYIRTQGQNLRYNLSKDAPDALTAQLDVLGGKDRLPSEGTNLEWGGGVITNFRFKNDQEWNPPAPKQNGWHKDGWHFRHFLDSPEQGLLTVPIYTEILPRSGGTFIAKDSIAPVARLLVDRPQGFHADSVQGGGYLIPYLVDQCTEFEELTGNAGDLAILHPYMLHRRSENPTTRPRFIANVAVVLSEPMCFDRHAPEPYSLAELAVLHALGKESQEFQAERNREMFVPSPFRDEENRKKRYIELVEEMQSIAAAGIVTPSWASEHGYMSNDFE